MVLYICLVRTVKVDRLGQNSRMAHTNVEENNRGEKRPRTPKNAIKY